MQIKEINLPEDLSVDLLKQNECILAGSKLFFCRSNIFI